MIEEINEFVNRVEATPTTGLFSAGCECRCDCTCGAELQMAATPFFMSAQGWFLSS